MHVKTLFYPQQSILLNQLLKITNLGHAQEKLQRLFLSAQDCSHFPVRLMQKISQIWYDPDIVPYLALKECLKNKHVVVPVWHDYSCVFIRNLPTKTGGSRRLVIATPEQRLAMSIVNTLFQTSCFSWSQNTFGFRPGYGTIDAMNTLGSSYYQMLQASSCNPVLVFFDLQKAYDTVHFSSLVKELQLYRLPRSLKDCIWRWHHPFLIPRSTPKLEGLPQGYNYCPTLFAWYLDKTVVTNVQLLLNQRPYNTKPNMFAVYADNFAAVIDKSHLEQVLQFATQTIAAEGLFIKPDSLMIVDPSQGKELTTSWLGHKLCLKTGTVLPNQDTVCYTSTAENSKETKKTFQDFKQELVSSEWLDRVKNSHWR
jgi:hypothetical protein